MKPAEQRCRAYPEHPDLEVLICTHDRAELLRRVLDSLNACERPAGTAIAVFVVANACADHTATLLRDYVRRADTEAGARGHAALLPLRWIEDPVPGKSHALNLALPLAAAPLVAFVDDDHRVERGYLAAVVRGAGAEPDAELFCGRILPDWDGTEPNWAHEQGRYRIYPLPVPRFELGSEPRRVEPGTATPGGGNLAVRRFLIERVGPFLLDFGPCGHDLGGAEDIEWVRRALAGGARLHYLPDMLQYHYVDPRRMTMRYVVAKAYERSASTTRLSPAWREERRLPLYMIRKAAGYALRMLLSLSQQRRRFYLTRLAAALGEIKGFRLSRRDAAVHAAARGGSDAGPR
jgi:GT2 family glycosyltransferase